MTSHRCENCTLEFPVLVDGALCVPCDAMLFPAPGDQRVVTFAQRRIPMPLAQHAMARLRPPPIRRVCDIDGCLVAGGESCPACVLRARQGMQLVVA